MKTGRKDWDEQIISVKSRAGLLALIETALTAAADSLPSGEVGELERKFADVLAGPIPEDEPVFLARGQEIHGPETARNWARRLASHPTSDHTVAEMAHSAMLQADAMERWPVTKQPDLKAGE